MTEFSWITSVNLIFSSFCDNTTVDGESFCAEHMHYESSRVIQMLNDIGSDIDWKSSIFHIACDMPRRVMKPRQAKKFYQYCPSLEGLLPVWLEQVDHAKRWLTACYDVFEHPDADSYKRFPVNIFHEAFPEFVDIPNELFYHGYWSTYEQVKAYGYDVKKAWERNIPNWLHQLGAMQQYIPYAQAVNALDYQEGERYVWRTGIEENSYAKDLFNMSSTGKIPVSPALMLKKDVDGTSSPSYEGREDLIPKVSIYDIILNSFKHTKHHTYGYLYNI